jgi:LysR family transcriptional regulator, low CO2-responsive transcriptional regulator
MDAISYKSRAFQGELSGKLNVSVVSTGKYVMPYFLADFMKIHQGVELVLDVTNKSQVLASLEGNQVDFSLVSVLPEKLSIDSVSLLPNKLYLVSGSGMQFDKPPYDSSLLNDLPLIFREQGSGTRLVIENYLQQNGISVRKKMELTSNEAVKQAVLAGLGISIMPLIGIRHELELKLLQIIPVKGFPIVSNWNLIWLKTKRFSPVAEAFLRYIRAEKDRIVAERFDWFVE